MDDSLLLKFSGTERTFFSAFMFFYHIKGTTITRSVKKGLFYHTSNTIPCEIHSSTYILDSKYRSTKIT